MEPIISALKGANTSAHIFTDAPPRAHSAHLLRADALWLKSVKPAPLYDAAERCWTLSMLTIDLQNQKQALPGAQEFPGGLGALRSPVPSQKLLTLRSRFGDKLQCFPECRFVCDDRILLQEATCTPPSAPCSGSCSLVVFKRSQVASRSPAQC